MSRPRILIADDHPGIREQLREMLSAEFDVVGTVSNGRAAIDAVLSLHPDLAVLDISMPLMNGLEAAAHIIRCDGAPRIIFLTVHDDPEFVEAAQRAGGRGYVLKRALAVDLMPAIRHVMEGCPEFFTTPGVSMHAVSPT